MHHASTRILYETAGGFPFSLRFYSSKLGTNISVGRAKVKEIEHTETLHLLGIWNSRRLEQLELETRTTEVQLATTAGIIKIH